MAGRGAGRAQPALRPRFACTGAPPPHLRQNMLHPAACGHIHPVVVGCVNQLAQRGAAVHREGAARKLEAVHGMAHLLRAGGEECSRMQAGVLRRSGRGDSAARSRSGDQGARERWRQRQPQPQPGALQEQAGRTASSSSRR